MWHCVSDMETVLPRPKQLQTIVLLLISPMFMAFLSKACFFFSFDSLNFCRLFSRVKKVREKTTKGTSSRMRDPSDIS